MGLVEGKISSMASRVWRSVFIGVGLLLFNRRPVSLKVAKEKSSAGRLLWVDVGMSTVGNRTTGVERLTREVSRRLPESVGLAGFDEVYFFRFSSFGQMTPAPPPEGVRGLKAGIWTPEPRKLPTSGDHVFLLNLSLPPRSPNKREIDYLSRRGVVVSAMIYDLLPDSHPAFFPHKKSIVFRAWLEAVSRARGAFFISETTRRRYFNREWPIDPMHSQTSVIPLGADGISERQTRQKRESSGKSRHPWNLLSLGTLEPRKDYDGLLDAMEVVWKTRLKVRLTIVGNRGWRCDGLANRIESHPHFGTLLFWESATTDRELEKIMGNSDGLIANAIDEGFGLPLIEASAAGLEVLARDTDIFREALPEAHFYEGGNVDALAEIIIQFCSGQIEARHPERHPVPKWDETTRQILSFLQSSAA